MSDAIVTELTVNLTDKTVSNGSGAWAPPPITFGEQMTLSFTFEVDQNGNAVDPGYTVNATYASAGFIDQRPTSGTWALQIGAGAQTGANTTAALGYGCTANQLQEAINALGAVTEAYGEAVVKQINGSYVILFGAGANSIPCQLRSNNLFPVCFGRIANYEQNGTWLNTVRLVQAPLAFTDVTTTNLPPAPTVAEVQEGGSNGGVNWNEVQSLYVPPNFNGSYILTWGTGGAAVQTSQLGVSSGYAAVQAALVAAGVSCTVGASGIDYTAYITFTGTMAGGAQPLIGVTVVSAGPPNLQLTLSFNQSALYVALWAKPTIAPQLEVWIDTEEAGMLMCFSVPITINAPLIWPDLATIPTQTYLRPPNPVDYTPFSDTTILIGQPGEPIVKGDGAATVFTIDHGLDTEMVMVEVRQNVSSGLQLANKVDFTVAIDDAMSVTVTSLVGPPAVNGWVIIVLSLQTVPYFAAGLTVTIGQVTGLTEALAALSASVSALQALAPTTPLALSTGGAPAVTINPPIVSEIFPPANWQVPNVTPAPTYPTPPGALLPAIQTNEVTSLTGADVLPSPTGNAGHVYQNNMAAAILLSGGRRTASSYAYIGDYIGCDGFRFYPLTKVADTTSYFPRDFEREPWAYEINAQMLAAGSELQWSFTLQLQLLGADTRAQWFCVVEWGTTVDDDTPATTAPNLGSVDWSATPIMSQRILLTQDPVLHTFGVQVLNTAGVISANKQIYGQTLAGDSAPPTGDFWLRVRMINFDTQDSPRNLKQAIPTPTGAVSYTFTSLNFIISAAP